MLRVVRQTGITDSIRRNGAVRVTDLAEQYDVTPETIRRDLDELEKQGVLGRIHGGAVSVTGNTEVPFNVRAELNSEEKQQMAQLALEEVHGHDVIALDASTSSLALACLLPNERRTVITNSLPIANELSQHDQVCTILTGGVLDNTTLAIHGSLAARTLAQFSISLAFISCFGFDEHLGAGDLSETHADLKRSMVEVAGRVILLADASKFARKPPFFFCRPDQIDRVISVESPALSSEEAALSEHEFATSPN